MPLNGIIREFRRPLKNSSIQGARGQITLSMKLVEKITPKLATSSGLR
jgi:hypothetical protein